jgi:SEL1 protein
VVVQEFEKAVKLYSELAATTMASFVSSREGPLLESVRLNYGLEESKDVLKRFRGEEDDDFQFLEYQVWHRFFISVFFFNLFHPMSCLSKN